MYQKPIKHVTLYLILLQQNLVMINYLEITVIMVQIA